MQEITRIVKKFPFSVLCFAVIWVLSLVPFFPETPLDGVEFIDKWVHVLMYGGACCVLWLEYLLKHRRVDWEKLFYGAWVYPIMMGGLLELLQAYCTAGHRSGDWLDFAADAVGTTLAALLGVVVTFLWRKS